MRTVVHALPSAAPGLTRELRSLHFGPAGGAKAYLQAGLHAEEIPGMLVCDRLRRRLAALEGDGLLRGEVVLVPLANPIGLSQRLLHQPVGRFDFANGDNFNRGYADLLEAAAERVELPDGLSTVDAVSRVRAALREACAALPADSDGAALRRTLLSLAVDADIVLDLHADTRSVLHLYTADPLWPQAEPLVRLLGAELVLLAEASGGQPFDEACSMLWPRLAERLSRRGPAAPKLPPACLAATVELRGDNDADPALADADADALLAFLAYRGLVDLPAPALPALKRAPRPLAGSMPVTAPHAGVLLFERDVGAEVRRGDRLGVVVDPVDGRTTPLPSPADGLLYARDLRAFALAGDRVAKVAGLQAARRGALLSP